jgi:energy-coupling factor transporter transmembrane protein EcfT
MNWTPAANNTATRKPEKYSINKKSHCLFFVLFCFVLFCFVLFCFVLFCFCFVFVINHMLRLKKTTFQRKSFSWRLCMFISSVMKTTIPPFDSVKLYKLIPHDSLSLPTL